MSSKILFLYFKQKHKTELLKCENIIKALFRKFRKSVVFSYMQIDISPTCREAFEKLLFSEISRHHAIMIKGDTEIFSEEEIFLKEILKLKASEYHTAGKVICYPTSKKAVEISDTSVREICTVSLEHLKYSAELSLKLSQSRKHLLTICTRPEKSIDASLFHAFQDAYDISMHINTENIPFDEMISLCTKTVPSFDTVLVTEEVAKVISSHLDSSARICSGHTILHTDNGKFHMSRTSGTEEISNARFASVLLTVSEILSKNFNMTNASDWFKKAVATAFETHAFSSFEDFSDKVIFEIQKPMRYTR